MVDHAPGVAEAEAFAETTDYDLILLDIMLPDVDGRSLLKAHRARSDETPVIVLDLGADDYLTKPFDFSELEARCRAVLRRLRRVDSGISNLMMQSRGR